MRVPEILKEYPRYYTWLLDFYRYVTYNSSEKKYVLTIPKTKTNNGIIEQIKYRSLEDALYERDFLVEHDWDYELLVENINDENNPYYELELPPYPERRIKANKKTNPHTTELSLIYELIKNNPDLSKKEISEKLNISTVTLGNWLSLYDTNFTEFKKIIVKDNKNPLHVLKLHQHIIQPDLSKSNKSTYIQKNYSKRSPYLIMKNKRKYGAYKDKKTAQKIVRELKKCNWDKNKLPEIQAKYGVVPYQNKQYIYSKGDAYVIRKRINNVYTNYGYYKDYNLAVIIRDLLKENGWCKDDYPSIRLLGEWIYNVKCLMENNMFPCSI